jgi:hypothetical protein
MEGSRAGCKHPRDTQGKPVRVWRRSEGVTERGETPCGRRMTEKTNISHHTL